MTGSCRGACAALALLLALLVAAAAPALADTTLIYAGPGGRYSVYMRPQDVRIDGDGPRWQLYHAGKPVLVSVSPKNRTYTRLDQHVAGAIRQRMNALRRHIQNRIAQLPPSQQAAARAAMTSQVPGVAGGTQTVGLDRTGVRDRVAGVPCQIIQIVRNGQPAHSMCVASAQALGISSAAFHTVQSMFALLKRMLAGTGLQGIGLPYRSLKGLPVRFIDSISGQRRSLIRVSHAPIPAARFKIPDDYVETAVALPQQ